jgi:DNA polymerase I-like protein with 3'-5' exonuclease and polymerase domains
MQAAYQSGDPYMYLARKAGAVPADATKASHPAVREAFKVVSLGVLFGLSEFGLARKLDIPLCRGRELLELHRQTFRRFWEWIGQVGMQGMLTRRLVTPFGWTLHVGPRVTSRTLKNFPMQASGADMLRVACCLATERGIGVCAPVHDALLVEGPADQIEDIVAATRDAMRQASEAVLYGFPCRVDAKVVRYPDRYCDERGRKMWETACALLDRLEGEAPCAPVPSQEEDTLCASA